MKNKKVWVLTGKSESGDDFGPYVFAVKPSPEKMSELCHDADGSEDKDGPGYDGSYIHLVTEEVTVQ